MAQGYVVLVALVHSLTQASAASWASVLGHDSAHQLTVAGKDTVNAIRAGCIPDIPGGPAVAGATMVAGILLTAGVTWALISYVVSKKAEQLSLPTAAAPSAPNTGSNGPDNSQGAVKPAVKKKRIYMYSLDGMRTLLTVAVIFAHYPLGLPAICKHFLGWPMQFFFVLSGFVAQVQQEAAGDFTLLSGVTYVARRLARILPLYQLALVFQYALAIYGQRGCQPVAAWPMNALLVQVFLPVQVCGEADMAWTMGYAHFNGNGPAWFAACIVWFSCLFPLLYNARPRSGAVWTFGLLVALLGCRAMPDAIHPKWATYGHGPHLYAFSPVRLMEYAAGMWAAQVASDAAQRWGSWNYWCWIFDATLLLLVGLIYVSLVYWGATWTCSGDYHLTAVCCLVCIAARLAAEMPDESREGFRGAILHRVIGSTPVSYVARFSFAAYIFQTSFMSFTDGDQNFYLHRFCILWVFSVFACFYIEEPIRLAAEARLKGTAKA